MNWAAFLNVVGVAFTLLFLVSGGVAVDGTSKTNRMVGLIVCAISFIVATATLAFAAGMVVN